MRRLLLPLLGSLSLAAAESPSPTGLDELVFANGERALGHVVAEEGGRLVFQSEHFGTLTVERSSVTLRRAGKEVASEVKGASAAEEGEDLNASLGAPLHDWMKTHLPKWGMGLDVSTELRHETIVKTNFNGKFHLARTGDTDLLRFESSYEYNTENRVNTTDMLKAGIYWRHDLTPLYFTVYEPKFEMNRCWTLLGIPFDYVLMRQQVGVGRVLWKRKASALRVGVAENYFKVWLWNRYFHGSAHATVESAFVEVDYRLPWSLRLVDRGTFYDELSTGDTGWENDLELTKQLTRYLKLGLRHEVRQRVPGVESSNYNLWRLFFGFDF